MYSNLYVAMAALAAITKHAGESLKIILFHESLKINFQYLDTLLIIDINTQKALNLIDGPNSLETLFKCLT
jgi:hypothetical protein